MCVRLVSWWIRLHVDFDGKEIVFADQTGG
jgi:hypothetical protein